jgi:hypothetical protein
VENKTGNDFVDRAIPHEAGHIVVGWVTGFPIKEMAVDIVMTQKCRYPQLGNFITRSVEPSDEQILEAPTAILAGYKLCLAGGLAGNNFAGVDASDESLQDDRRKLARVGTESLEAMAKVAIKIIREHSQIFETLNTRITQRFLKLMDDPYLNTGRHTLLNEKQLAECFVKAET